MYIVDAELRIGSMAGTVFGGGRKPISWHVGLGGGLQMYMVTN